MTSLSLLAACGIPLAGDTADRSFAEDTTGSEIRARGWILPEDGSALDAGPKSVRGAHALVAIDPPADEEIETADIPAPSSQGSRIEGNPTAGVFKNAVDDAEIIVRSIER